MPGRRLPLLALAVLGVALPTVTASAAPRAAVPTLLFPVVAAVTYTDDFGQPRSDGPPHPGNDLLAARKAPVVAVEGGTVKLWTTSPTAGCMLYLYGDSGTTYEYIHLNNDRTSGNDNRGSCVPGIAYASGLKTGARVQAGQLLGYVGDSGDADGIHPHLHFEVHPDGGAAADPYPYLQASQHLLFYAQAGAPFSLLLTGTVVATTDTTLQLRLSALQAFPSNLKLKGLTQTVTLAVPPSAVVLPPASAPAARLLAAYAGEPAAVWTQPAPATLGAQLGADGTLTAALVQLK